MVHSSTVVSHSTISYKKPRLESEDLKSVRGENWYQLVEYVARVSNRAGAYLSSFRVRYLSDTSSSSSGKKKSKLSPTVSSLTK